MSAPPLPSPSTQSTASAAPKSRWRRRTLKPWLWLGLILSLILLGYAGWWWSAARTLEAWLESWQEAEAAVGNRVTIGRRQISGFPTLLRLEIRDIAWTRSDGVAWSGAVLTAEARPWAITAIRVTLRDGHQIRAPLAGGSWLIAKLQDGDGVLNLALGEDLYSGQLTLRDVQIHPALHDAPPPPADSMLRIESLEFTLSHPLTPPTDFTTVGLAGALRAARLHLPASAPDLFNTSVVDSLGLSARIMGALPPPTTAGLENWSRAGGVLELDSASLTWGALSATVNATFSLDSQLQPQLAGTLDVRGSDTVLEALLRQNIIRRKDAVMAKTALSLLAQPRGEDPEPVLSLPVTVQNRTLSLGPFKLLTVPWVSWPS